MPGRRDGETASWHGRMVDNAAAMCAQSDGGSVTGHRGNGTLTIHGSGIVADISGANANLSGNVCGTVTLTGTGSIGWNTSANAVSTATAASNDNTSGGNGNGNSSNGNGNSSNGNGNGG